MFTVGEHAAVDMTLTRSHRGILLAVCLVCAVCQAAKWDGITPWFSGSCKSDVNFFCIRISGEMLFLRGSFCYCGEYTQAVRAQVWSLCCTE
jgi:hypothetical protein